MILLFFPSLALFCSVLRTCCCFLAPAVLDTMKHLNETKPFTALYVTENEMAEITPYLSDLPTPIALWTSLNDERFWNATVHKLTGRQTVVIVPSSETNVGPIMSFLNESWVPRRNAHWLFTARKHEDVLLRVPDKSLCYVATMTASEISVPLDSYYSCRARKNGTPDALVKQQDINSFYPRDNTIVFFEAFDYDELVLNLSLPEMHGLIEAYEHLNNTLVQFKSPRRDTSEMLYDRVYDFILFPPTPDIPLRYTFFYRDAQFSPCHMCFMSRPEGLAQPSFVDSWMSLWFFLFGLLSFGASVLAVVLAHHRLCTPSGLLVPSGLTMSLVSTLLGKSSGPLRVHSISARLAIFSWMAGALFLSVFLQTSITASKSVPASVPNLDSHEKLVSAIRSGRYLPCAQRTTRRYMNDTVTDYFKLFGETFQRCDRPCFQGHGEHLCYERAVRGTHVYIATCCAHDLAVASTYGLVTGKESLGLALQACVANTNWPLRFAHKRLTQRVLETKIGFRNQSYLRWQPMQPMKASVEIPFYEYFKLYAIACFSSALVFIAEMLHKGLTTYKTTFPTFSTRRVRQRVRRLINPL